MARYTEVLRPGLMVRLHTSIEGGVRYYRKDLSTDRESIPGGEVAEWQTERVTSDVEEHQRAVDVRSKAQAIVRRVCSFVGEMGLLCAQEREADLDEAIDAAEALADEFNRTARYSRVVVCVGRAVIRADDERTAEAIVRDVDRLVKLMQEGVANLDVEGIRKAASRAREAGRMLSPREGERVSQAIDAAREAARAIVRRIEKGGEAAAEVLRDLNVRPIAAARFSYLEDPAERQVVLALPEVPKPAARELEVDAALEVAREAAPKVSARYSGLWVLEGGV